MARLVLHEQTVKNSPNHNHDEQRAEIFVHRSKKPMKERAARQICLYIVLSLYSAFCTLYCDKDQLSL